MPVVPLHIHLIEEDDKKTSFETIWPSVPKVGEGFVKNERFYQIVGVTHNHDNNEIHVLCNFVTKYQKS